MGSPGPGTRFVLFVSGCPLRCLYCANPDTWHMRDGKETSVDEVMAKIEKYRAFVTASGGGVTVTGGEPLLQHTFTGCWPTPTWCSWTSSPSTSRPIVA